MDIKQIFAELKEGKITSEDAVSILRDLKESVVKTTVYPNGVILVKMADLKNKNMFSKELITGLMRIFDYINKEDKCKAVILTGSDNYFACGGDEDGLLGLYNGTIKMQDFGVYEIPLKCRVPVIAAISGHAIGGGWCLGMFCDFVILSEESRYMCNHMKYGFTPGDGATLIFPEKLGNYLAQEILYTGRTYKGKQLKERGANLPIVSRKDVLTEAKALADEIAQAPLKSLILLKEHMTEELKKRLKSTVNKEWENQKKTLVNNPYVLRNILGGFASKEPVSEVVSLNSANTGNPVFWVHGDEGDVEGYYAIARNCDRPFYGIKLTKYVEKDARFTNVQILANDYVEQIKKIQKTGPYNLGGYSIGGIIAYEMVRQLQMMGEEVNSLVLIETPLPEKIVQSKKSDDEILLQGVNRTLLSRNRYKKDDVMNYLIKPNEVSDDRLESYLYRLIELGKSRGLSQEILDGELWDMFWGNFLIKKHLLGMKMDLLPLDESENLKCYYFKNKNGVYYGQLNLYFLKDKSIEESLKTAFKEWQKIIQTLEVKNINATSRFTILYEPKAVKEMIEKCKEIYCKNDNGREEENNI